MANDALLKALQRLLWATNRWKPTDHATQYFLWRARLAALSAIEAEEKARAVAESKKS